MNKKKAKELVSVKCESLVKSYVKMALMFSDQVYSKYFISQNSFLKFSQT